MVSERVGDVRLLDLLHNSNANNDWSCHDVCYRRIGDWYPERNIFQILIAITSGIYLWQYVVFDACLHARTGPRFALIILKYMLSRAASLPKSRVPSILLVVGFVRTLSCGGWVYITSNDDHDSHDVLMILYILCNVPWMWCGVRLASGKARRRRYVNLSDDGRKS